jgi:two-component system nitrate/nitrite response regulator NarL
MRILLYSPVPIVTKGFAIVLSSVPEFDLVAVCSNEQQLPQAVAASDPDLVLIDLDEEMALDRLFEMRREIPERSRIVLWVQSITPELAYQTMRLGVRGILRKTLGADVIVRCLQKVAEGECWFEEALTASFLNIRTVRLTRRESQLLSLVSRGFKNKEIAEALFIAEPTVKIYLSRLFRKVGAKDRFELALYGLRNVITGQVSAFGAGRQTPTLEPATARRPPVLLVEDPERPRPRPQPLAVRSIA